MPRLPQTRFVSIEDATARKVRTPRIGPRVDPGASLGPTRTLDDLMRSAPLSPGISTKPAAFVPQPGPSSRRPVIDGLPKQNPDFKVVTPPRTNKKDSATPPFGWVMLVAHPKGGLTAEDAKASLFRALGEWEKTPVGKNGARALEGHLWTTFDGNVAFNCGPDEGTCRSGVMVYGYITKEWNDSIHVLKDLTRFIMKYFEQDSAELNLGGKKFPIVTKDTLLAAAGN